MATGMPLEWTFHIQLLDHTAFLAWFGGVAIW
jgi:hypothetical protein